MIKGSKFVQEMVDLNEKIRNAKPGGWIPVKSSRHLKALSNFDGGFNPDIRGDSSTLDVGLFLDEGWKRRTMEFVR